MVVQCVSIVAGLTLLVWSADRFVEGAAATARHYGMTPLLIGMVVVGFGTSVPEMVVSALASLQNSPGIAIGNAYGSNITNIALILGVTALLRPIAFRSTILRKELPILLVVTILSALLLWDGRLARWDAVVLLGTFFVLMVWTIRQGKRRPGDTLAADMEQELDSRTMPIRRAIFWLLLGLALLIASSRLLVWGAVGLAQAFGVPELFIGLTVVAVGTSLPELASSLVAARKGEHDIALGNVLGSNLFNTLAVVGLAGALSPMTFGPEVLTRDMLTMGALTVALFAIGYGFRGPGRINKFEGGLLLIVYAAYTAYLLSSMFV